MKNSLRNLLSLAALLASPCLAADGLDPAVQAKVEAKLKEVRAWAAEPALVAAVKEANAQPRADVAGLSQEKWAALTVLDPLVRSFTKTAAGELLKTKKSDPAVSEAFLSAADGTKVAFLSKPTNWSHKGKPKHDVPMSGKTWQGKLEVDESTGLQQVQIAVPVVDGSQAIGSLVVGLSVSKLN